MNLQFETPTHGWMVITYNDNELVVSDAPCNSLLMLTSALVRILSGSNSEIVEWSLEPDYAAWIFERDGAEIAFYLRESSSSDAVLIERDAPALLVDQILAALRNLAARNFWKHNADDLQSWSWPFPLSNLEHVKKTPADTALKLKPLTFVRKSGSPDL